MNSRRIDLNCDLGENDSPAGIALDLDLLDVVTSVNIACGGHAGDDATMTATIKAALARGVAIGAHPGYADPARFGRVRLDLAAAQIEALVAEQLERLMKVARPLGARLNHVKLHGALYHDAMTREGIAESVSRAVSRCDRGLILVALAGASALDLWRSRGFSVAVEAFADRRYDADGSLWPRNLTDALITDPTEAAAQATRLALGESVLAADHAVINLPPDTICVHSDTPGALNIARAVRAGLESHGVRIRPFGAH